MQANKKVLVWVGLAVAGVLCGFVWFKPDNNLHLVVCDVGQGDAILVIKGSDQVLIDGGPDDAVLSCLARYVPFWDREIELVVMTNGDADHMTGLIEVMRRYSVVKMVANNLVKDTEKFKALREEVLQNRVPVYGPEAGDEIQITSTTGTKSTKSTTGSTGSISSTSTKSTIGSTERTGGTGELILKVLWPEERLGNELVWASLSEDAGELNQVLGANTYSTSQANEQSVAMKLAFGDFEAVLTGDVGIESEPQILTEGIGKVAVLKVGHHGSRYSTSSEFLGVVDPDVAVISVGKKNRYGHPSPEVVERLQAMGAKILRTDEVGDVEIVTDGARYWIAR